MGHKVAGPAGHLRVQRLIPLREAEDTHALPSEQGTAVSFAIQLGPSLCEEAVPTFISGKQGSLPNFGSGIMLTPVVQV